METLFGLPAHPLVVHAAVVLVPLAAVGIVLTAFWPSMRHRLAWTVVVVALLGFVAAFLAKESGESLEEEVDETELVEQHAELGDTGVFAAGAVLVGTLAVAGLHEIAKRRSEGVSAVVALSIGAVAVVLAVGGTVQIGRIGHSGAEATWDDVGREGGENGD